MEKNIIENNSETYPFDLQIYTILKVRIGSKSHGTNLQDSDDDIRCICIPPIDYFFGIKNWDQTIIKKENKDIEYWSINKFVNLLIKGNPSATNLLFTRNRDIFEYSYHGRQFIENRYLFVSKRTISAIIGYIKSQLHKIAIGRGRYGNRQKLIDKYGFDTHFAYHAVMLSYMAIELCKRSEYSVYRPKEERDFIKLIRTGQIKIEEVLKVIENNLLIVKTLERSCNLKDSPNEEEINEFLKKILIDYFMDNVLKDYKDFYPVNRTL